LIPKSLILLTCSTKRFLSICEQSPQFEKYLVNLAMTRRAHIRRLELRMLESIRTITKADETEGVQWTKKELITSPVLDEGGKNEMSKSALDQFPVAKGRKLAVINKSIS